MINIKFSNQAATVLTEPVITTDTTITVADAVDFPSIVDDAFFMICVANAGEFEIMKVVAVVDNVFTVQRSQEGTAVKAFPIGAAVENRLTAGSLNSIIENASETVAHASDNPDYAGQATDALYGHIRITDDDTSEATSILGIGVSPYAMKKAFDKILGASTQTVITTSGNFTATVAGAYTVTCVGGGGSGGYGGTGWMCFGYDDGAPNGDCIAKQGGAGGGGGAGQVVTKTVTLAKGQIVSVTIGGPGGATSFGSYNTVSAGGNGGAGSSPSPQQGCTYSTTGYGGSAGSSYGSVATAGANGAYYTRLCGYNPTIDNNYSVGRGGVSNEGTYGNGGNGGYGGGCWGQRGAWGGGPGSAGTQGCVKIRLAVG